MELKNMCVQVTVYYGYGISFVIPLIVPKDTSEESIKQAAIEHFKKYMPTKEEIDTVENLIQEEKAFIEIEYDTIK